MGKVETLIKHRFSLTYFIIVNLLSLIGSQSDLWIDVVEWLVDRSAHKLFVLIDEENLNSSFERRISKLKKLKQSNVVITSYSQLHSLEETVKLLKNVSKVGSVSNIFFVNMVSSKDLLLIRFLVSFPSLKLVCKYLVHIYNTDLV